MPGTVSPTCGKPMFLFLTVIQGLIAAALVGIILMQKSEGGGLGLCGGSPSSIFSARGAGDFLTRSTAILATLFVVFSIILAGVAVNSSSGGEVDDSLDRQALPADVAPAPQPAVPATTQSAPAQDESDPLSGLAE